MGMAPSVSRRTLTVLVAIAVVAVGAFVALRPGGGGDASSSSSSTWSSSSRSPSSTPTVEADVKALPEKVPSAAPTLDGSQRETVRTARTQLLDFVELSTALQDKQSQAALRELAAGPALSEIQALAQQYDNEGITVSGTPTVRGVRVISIDGDDVVLGVCLDSTPVRVTSDGGRVLSADRPRRERIVLNLYQLQQVDGSYRVVNHSIPADSSCRGGAA